MLSCIPTRWYQLSPIRLADGPPFSPERSCVLHAFLLLAFAYLPFYKNAIRRIRLQIGFANLLLHPLTSNLLPFFYARSRESNMDSCRPVNAKRSHRLKNGVAIFADSKQSLRPLSFLSRTGNVLHAFHLQSFCILAFFKREHSASLLQSTKIAPSRESVRILADL